MTEEEQDQFIDDYFEKEGIHLDPNNIEYNAGIRSVMKIMLNSFWGKFGQRPNMMQSKICLTANDFYSIILNERYDVKGMYPSPENHQVVELLYKEYENDAEEPLTTNVYMACFTTCHARLKLHDALTTLGESVLYYDTDSVFFVRKKSEECPVKLGSYLGDLTDELSSDGSRYITEFVSTGPKSYCFRDNEGLVKCKFKGLSKSLFNLNVINFKSMLRCITEGTVFGGPNPDDPSGPQNLVFKLDRFGRIKTDYTPKIFRMVYTKRSMHLPDYNTLPWGY